MPAVRRWSPVALLTLAIVLTTVLVVGRTPTSTDVATGAPAGRAPIGAAPSLGGTSSNPQPVDGAPGATETVGAPSTTLVAAADGGSTPAAAPPAAAGPTPVSPSSGAAPSASPVAPAPGPAPAGAVSRGGISCGPGVSQIPQSTYAAPCIAAWTGDNGGATARGVSADTITVVHRRYPDNATSAAAASFTEQAGGADAQTNRAVRDVYVDYFNRMYETYGRRVEIIDYEAQHGNLISENFGNGREDACLDADKIQEAHDPRFVVMDNLVGSSLVFSECAAERGMTVLDGAFYTEDSFYERNHPYVFNLFPDCDRIAAMAAEYMGKRLANRPTQHAGDPTINGQERRFGLYVPDRDDFQNCAARAKAVLAETYDAEIASTYEYTIDLARLADQAQRGMTQFRADGVTSVMMLMDPLSAVFITQAATNQAYFPEFINFGVALTDVDAIARLMDQNAVDGSFFGMSYLGDTSTLLTPDSEPGRVYREATGGEDIPDGATGHYSKLMMIFNAVQTAGPNLNEFTLADGLRSMAPLGAPDYQFGAWSFLDGPDGTPGVGDHTATDDAREIYWTQAANGPDGRPGTFLATLDGARFTPGTWPVGEPPVYPGS